MKFGYNWLCGFWGDVWNYHNMRVLGQILKNDLDLLYSQTFHKTTLMAILGQNLQNFPGDLMY